ncbi:family 16 glycoside hydrolase [Stieleria varia]|uniref:Cytochrome c n=1 Tax=Stieleria varia TaxID=2528005 RepID=A0A5C6ASF7_9BACT|nr:family 16 glycoside hydrolase [Stieleria varia]TWU02209.1 Cytochrome c [Stieleria varia]
MNRNVLATAFIAFIALPIAAADDFETLFNGNDLSGWKGLDGFWSVEDSAIVGETTREQKIDANTFLIWQGGDVADFEFMATVRFQGNNSGVQYRSNVIDEQGMALMGYQMDLHPFPKFFGMLYGEKYGERGKIATRGQRVEISADGNVKQLGKVGNNDNLTDWKWNKVRIIAVGDQLIHQVNGVTTIDVTDQHPRAITSGKLGLQLHKGPPMRVEFKDLRLRKLDHQEGKKLISTFANQSNDENEIEEDAATPAPPPSEGGGARNRKTDVGSLRVAKGFKVETVYSVPQDTQGSWVSMTIDDKGRLIASDQGGRGLFRVTIKSDREPLVEKLPVDLSSAQGLLWKSGCLYASITGKGMYRVTDSDGDNLPDRAELLSEYSGKGEHGNHALIDTEDGDQIYAVSGNQTPLPSADSIVRRRNPSRQEDLLLPRQWDPRGHAAGVMAPGGWITRFDPARKTHDLFCAGFRNEYDAALNAHGDLFTYDADMEWDLGLPWYRPTRICHAVSGGDFGWRSGSGKWKEYYEDSLPPLVNIGPGSPTGVVSGRGAKFPAKYQHAIFALDWTYGRILAIHLTPDGASYNAEAEDFVAGPALPVTDAVMGADGALYFATGGRGTKSELMRVVYTGKASTAPAMPAELPEAAKTRRALETFHGIRNSEAIETAWPHLSSDDRFLRHAARVAIESQPVNEWAAKVFSESNPQARITSAVALARMGNEDHRERLLECANELPFSDLSVSQQLGLLRAYALILERLGSPSKAQREQLIAKLDPLLPSSDADVNHELLRLLVFLRAPTAAAKGMQLIADRGPGQPVSWSGVEKLNARYGNTLKQITKNPPPTAAIDIALTLRSLRNGWTPGLRRQYFAFLNTAAKASGGASYPSYLTNIRDEALSTCSDSERIALTDLTGENFNPVPDFPIVPPTGPGQEWTLETAMAAVDSANPKKLNFNRGRSLFHAVSCGACHRFSGLGGGVGPDLTSVPNKFTSKYLLEAIIDPSKNISDQYQSSMVLLDSGKVANGLVVDKDDETILVYSSDPKSEPTIVKRDEIEEISVSQTSQMPKGLLNQMSPDELRNLVAYIMSGGNESHKVYRGRGGKK